MKKYLKFLIISLITALIFEFLANKIGDGTLFDNSSWPKFFLIWYGVGYTILYVLFKKRPVWQGIIFFVILGNVVEIFVFHRSNLLVDSIIYALMALIPLWANKRSSLLT